MTEHPEDQHPEDQQLELEQQPCQHGRAIPEAVMDGLDDRHTHCYFHCVEEVPEDLYRICAECGHPWTASSLLREHNLELIGTETGRTLEIQALDPPEHDPEQIYSCPLCLHDW